MVMGKLMFLCIIKDRHRGMPTEVSICEIVNTIVSTISIHCLSKCQVFISPFLSFGVWTLVPEASNRWLPLLIRYNSIICSATEKPTFKTVKHQSLFYPMYTGNSFANQLNHDPHCSVLPARKWLNHANASFIKSACESNPYFSLLKTCDGYFSWITFRTLLFPWCGCCRSFQQNPFK